MKSLIKGRYTVPQVNAAKQIRTMVLQRKPWNLDASQASAVEIELCNITSPLFFIRYKRDLLNDHVIQALSAYRDNNSRRKATYGK